MVLMLAAVNDVSWRSLAQVIMATRSTNTRYIISRSELQMYLVRMRVLS